MNGKFYRFAVKDDPADTVMRAKAWSQIVTLRKKGLEPLIPTQFVQNSGEVASLTGMPKPRVAAAGGVYYNIVIL